MYATFGQRKWVQKLNNMKENKMDIVLEIRVHFIHLGFQHRLDTALDLVVYPQEVYSEVNNYIIAFEYYIIHFLSCSVLESAMHVCNFWA
jgi:hypothetical protein